MKLAYIKTSMTEINTRLGVARDAKSFSDFIVGLQKLTGDIKNTLANIVAGIPHISAKTDDIINISYLVSAVSATWSQQNNSIKYTAAVTGIYRLSVLSAEKFRIFTIYPWRHDTDKDIGSIIVGLNKGDEETFILEAVDKKLTATTYWWCLEFVAETPQLVTA